MLGLQGQWTNPILFIALMFVTEGLRAMRLVGGGALTMRLCTPAIAATQFAVFMALFNLGTVLGGLALGWLDDLGGIPAMLIATALASALAAALACAAKVGR
jgi:MFS transporter, PAT family, beta-lactamase induction signal transducer AmpG